MMATPLSTSTESLSAAVDTAFQALKQCRLHLSHLTASAQDAWRERDEAISAMQASRNSDAMWKEKATACKTALEQAEIKLQQQDSTITQLRKECTQWKDQSRNWQEHFLRVEQERCRLTLRLEELVTENQAICALRANAVNPFTSSAFYHDNMIPPTSPSVMKRMSISHESPGATPPPKKVKVMKTPPRQPTPHYLVDASSKIKPITAAQTAMRDTLMETAHIHAQTHTPLGGHSPTSRPSRSEPRQTLIRRVQTVIEVPVKEEVDDASLDLFSDSVDSTAGIRHSRRRKSHTRTKDTMNSRARRNELEAEEDSAESNYSAEDNDEEDDELRIGTEDNHKELYGFSSLRTPASSNGAAPLKKARRKSIGHSSEHRGKGRKV